MDALRVEQGGSPADEINALLLQLVEIEKRLDAAVLTRPCATAFNPLQMLKARWAAEGIADRLIPLCQYRWRNARVKEMAGAPQ